VQLGIDTDADGRVNVYVDADDPRPLTTPVVAVRLWLLVRSDSSEAGVGFRDAGVYAPPDADLPPIRPGVTAGYPADFRRLAVSQTILLRNRPDRWQ